MLCDICVGVLTHRANFVTKIDDHGLVIVCAHHRTTETLEKSAVEGCHVCQAFWLLLSENEQEALQIAESRRLQMPDELNPSFEWLTLTHLKRYTSGLGGDYLLTVSFRGSGIAWKSVSAKSIHEPGFHVLQIDTGKLSVSISSLELISYKDKDVRPGNVVRSCDTESDESWTTAMAWLNNCLTTHTNCNMNRDHPAWYPTRLLDFGLPQDSHSIIRLIHSAEEMINGPYVTLSHCWGKSLFIQLNKNTFSALKSGVSIDDMPRTFREAIGITRRLGARYIWIDSMCIQQVRRQPMTSPSDIN
jgi:hypothetical protein